MAWFRKSQYTTLKSQHQRGRIPQGLWIKCPSCLEPIVRKDWDEGLEVCPSCGFHNQLTAQKRIGQLLDRGSFEEKDEDLLSSDPLQFQDKKPYPERIELAREKTGINEAVICGNGEIHALPVSIAVMDMGFIGGSMGAVVGEKIARTLERAIENETAAILVCSSGGARMQEGILSLMQMAKTGALAARLAEKRLPLITILAHPTTGGVTASFAMLGDVIIAEPKALIGFAGPRVIEQTIKQILPPGFQKSEFVSDHGFIDIVCRRTELRSRVANLLSFFLHSRGADSKSRPLAERDSPSSKSELTLEPASPSE